MTHADTGRTPCIEERLAAARDYAPRYRALVPGFGPLPSIPLAVVTCMDARIIPSHILGAPEGRIQVMRNAGGLVTDDVVRSLVVSQRRLRTREILVLQHTGCGMASFTDEDLLAEIEQDAGARPGWAPGAFGDVEASVRDGVARLRACPWLVDATRVAGAVFDLADGSVRVVA
ncbi:MAG: carbonic anhydrase [Thermoleophilia bacterium]|jgi:carbonic anhydrase|nr:carbonic anhydrase [Thermoleophilia bacterium]